jgi:hypothetical protein
MRYGASSFRKFYGCWWLAALYRSAFYTLPIQLKVRCSRGRQVAKFNLKGNCTAVEGLLVQAGLLLVGYTLNVKTMFHIFNNIFCGRVCIHRY